VKINPTPKNRHFERSREIFEPCIQIDGELNPYPPNGTFPLKGKGRENKSNSEKSSFRAKPRIFEPCIQIDGELNPYPPNAAFH